MDAINALLRRLPRVDALLATDEARAMIEKSSYALTADAMRAALDEARARLLAGGESVPDAAAILRSCGERLAAAQRPSQRPVINATGILLHTNLGRAPLPMRAADAVYSAATHYTNLELDCETGERSDRYSHVEGLICALTGAESALVVNNNAAAALLMLSALARGREVIVSRGELVEIGGSFRVPEVMEQSGCTLREVGATNKTHPRDYANAICEATAAVMKVHTSNYRIVGFTEDVPFDAMADIAHAAGLPLLHDIGSGAFLPLSRFGLRDEPMVRDSISRGADVVCFSGDKLMGGAQAGIIAGKKRYIDAMKSHPLMRALRVDKLTLAALEATLSLYSDKEQAAREIPLYAMLSQTVPELSARAERLRTMLEGISGLRTDIIPVQGQIGGGSAPGETFPSAALAVRVDGMSADALYRALLCSETPVVARISENRLILDMRTVAEAELPAAARALGKAACGKRP